MVSWIADGFVALGFSFVFLAFKENSYTSAVIEVADEQKVISSGTYRGVRHPLHVGVFVLLLFSPLALGSRVAFPFPIPPIQVIAMRLSEAEKFPAESLRRYDEYLQ